MGKTVIANGRTIIHKGHGATHVCAIPDVCKTPSPGGPVPIPYVNVAKDGDLSKGSKKVKIEGNPIAIASSTLGTSSGDEAGTAGGGLVSSKTKGKMSWAAVSMDVKVEGKGVARFLDPTLHNGNSYNSSFIAQGGTGFAYGDDGDPECGICTKPAEEHAILETPNSAEKAKTLIAKLKEVFEGYKSTVEERDKLEMDLQGLKMESEAAQKEINAQIGKATLVNDRDTVKKLKGSLKAAKGEYKGRAQQVRALNSVIGGQKVHKPQGQGGYMIGVMICITHPDKVFAAMSGQKSLPGFEKAVKDLGWKLCDAAATPADFQAVNPGADAPADPGRGLAASWSTCESSPEEGFNPPGECAAAKLVTKSGHAPMSMTEMYFCPPDRDMAPKQFTFKYLTPWRSALSWLTLGVFSTTVTRSFPAETTVPSCKTCQKLLPMALCEQKETC